MHSTGRYTFCETSQTIAIRNTIDAIDKTQQILERALIPAFKYTALITLTSIAALAYVLIKGFAVSLVTQGQFTTLNAALLSSPYIFPLALGALKVGFVATIIFGTLLASVVVFKCFFSCVTGKTVSWVNWHSFFNDII